MSIVAVAMGADKSVFGMKGRNAGVQTVSPALTV